MTEQDLATGHVLASVHERLRSVENLLELEAQDPRVGDLQTRVRKLRKDVAIRLVGLAVDAAEEVMPAGR